MSTASIELLKRRGLMVYETSKLVTTLLVVSNACHIGNLFLTYSSNRGEYYVSGFAGIALTGLALGLWLIRHGLYRSCLCLDPVTPRLMIKKQLKEYLSLFHEISNNSSSKSTLLYDLGLMPMKASLDHDVRRWQDGLVCFETWATCHIMFFIMGGLYVAEAALQVVAHAYYVSGVLHMLMLGMLLVTRSNIYYSFLCPDFNMSNPTTQRQLQGFLLLLQQVGHDLPTVITTVDNLKL